MFKKIFIFIFQILVLSILAINVHKLSVENNVWLDDKNLDKINKTHLENEFNVKEATLIIVKLNDDFFKQKYIDELRDVTKKLKKIDIPNLDFKTPLNVNVVINRENRLDILKFDSALKQSLIDIDEYKKRFNNSIYKNGLVSKDNTQFLISIGLDDKYTKFQYRDRLISQIKDILNSSKYFNNYILAGGTPLLHNIDKKNLYSIIVTLVIALAIFLISLIIIYRNLIKIVIIFISSIGAVLISINIILYLHINLNSINIIIPIIAITIAVADSIHILSKFEKLSGSTNRIKNTFKETIKPCFLTSFTTLVGFGSFYFSQIIPLKNFAIEAMWSIGAIFIFSVLGTFVNLYIFDKFIKKNKIQENKTLIYLNFIIIKKWFRYIVLFIILLSILLIAILTKSTAETNFLHVFFKPYEKIYQNFIFFDNNFDGTGNFDLLLQGKKEEFKDLDKFNQIIKLQREFEKHKSVIATKSYTDYISMVNQEVLNKKYPTDQDGLAQEILFIELSKSASKDDLLSNYTNFDYSEIRINIKTPNINSSKSKELVDYIDSLLKKENIKNYILTGNEYFVFKLGKHVIVTQIESIVISLTVVSILFIFLYGFRFAIFATIANVLPIIATLGLLVASGNSFDFATVAIAGVAIGFCVDDTIHIMHNFLKYKNIPLNIAIFKTIKSLYKPLLITTIILGICFFSFFFSSMVVTQKFGIFGSFAVVVAFLSDMVVLPSFILYFNKFLRK